MTLSTEIAAARPEDQREVLERLYDVVIPREHGTGRKLVWGSDHALQFLAMLDCGAFLSAAEMLTAERSWMRIDRWPADFCAPVASYCPLIQDADNTSYVGNGATPALALAAAIAKSLKGD